MNKETFKVGDLIKMKDERWMQTGHYSNKEGKEINEVVSLIGREGDPKEGKLFDILMENQVGKVRVANSRYFRLATEEEVAEHRLKNLFK